MKKLDGDNNINHPSIIDNNNESYHDGIYENLFGAEGQQIHPTADDEEVSVRTGTPMDFDFDILSDSEEVDTNNNTNNNKHDDPTVIEYKQYDSSIEYGLKSTNQTQPDRRDMHSQDRPVRDESNFSDSSSNTNSKYDENNFGDSSSNTNSKYGRGSNRKEIGTGPPPVPVGYAMMATQQLKNKNSTMLTVIPSIAITGNEAERRS
jgi:hypothetical protein